MSAPLRERSTSWAHRPSMMLFQARVFMPRRQTFPCNCLAAILCRLAGGYLQVVWWRKAWDTRRSEVKKQGFVCEVIVINDGSTDNSLSLLDQNKDLYDQLITYEKNKKVIHTVRSAAPQDASKWRRGCVNCYSRATTALLQIFWEIVNCGNRVAIAMRWTI